MFFPSIAMLGLGMAVSVAPLTTTVMNALDESGAGTASGVNNAVSRVAGLMAVAVLGLVLVTGFNHALDRRLGGLSLNADARKQVDAQRPRLAAAEVPDAKVERAIQESFIDGYRMVLWAATGLAVASAGCAWWMLDDKRR